MADIMISPAAPIFWCWHAFLDHVYYDWQFCQVTVPQCKGTRLGMARLRIRLSGLKVGNITRIPSLMIRPELISSLQQEKLDPLLLEHQIPTRSNISDHEVPEAARAGSHTGLSDPFRQLVAGPLVIGQSPTAGTTVSQGSSVDLTVMTDE